MESGGPSPLPSFPASRSETPSMTGNTPPRLNGVFGGSDHKDDGGATTTTTTTATAAAKVRRTKICVYCGANAGNNPQHLQAARELAQVMAANNIGLVYGGGTIGIMGELARTLVSLSGPDSVHGIIPEALVKYERDQHYTSSQVSSTSAAPEEATAEATAAPAASPAAATDKTLNVPDERLFGRTTVVRDMHSRKQLMAREVIEGGPGSGFVALSGGYGTLEELLETCTWNQLGIHDKGICILNINGFYDGILDWIDNAVKEGFIKGQNGLIIARATDANGAVDALKNYRLSDSVLKLKWGTQ